MSCPCVLLVAACLCGADLDPVVVSGESQPTATRLKTARQRQADGKTAEAVNLLVGLLEAGADDLVPLSPTRSVRARTLAHAALARLDAEGLALYRRRAEPQARKWLEDGQERRVVDEAFCTTAALTALDRLGDAAFARGAFDAAEQCWRMIAPLEKDDDEGQLVHPDPTPEQTARAKAKQLLARRFTGRAGWADDLARYRKEHPKAAGTLAARKGTYADVLEATPTPALPEKDWRTFGGSPERGRAAAGQDRLLDHLARLCRAGPSWRFDLRKRERMTEAGPAAARREAVDAARRMAYYPALVGTTAFVADGRHVTAYDLRTGKADVWFDLAKHMDGLRVLPQPLPTQDVRHSVTVADGHVYARLGTETVHDVRPTREGEASDAGSVLVCLRAGPGGGDRRRWMVRAYQPGKKEHAVFEGAPLVTDDRALIAATRFVGDRVVTAIHCYAARSDEAAPAPLWKADVCETRELLPSGAGVEGGTRYGRPRHHLLTRAGNLVVYCSHSGVIVALDARTGARAWAVRYPRREVVEVEDEPTLRDLAPVLCAEGRLYVAPADSDKLLCLDAPTGRQLWHRDRLDAVHLLGVGRGRLIFTTWRSPAEGRLDAGGLRAIDALTGGDDSGWVLPDDGGGLVPFGRGLLVGDLVLWPTYRRPYGVFAVGQEDGRQPDNPALLHRVPSGNLVYANGILLVTDRVSLHAFVPRDLLPDEDKGEVRREVSPERAKLAGLIDAGRWKDVMGSPALARIDVRDESGLPQSARFVARRELKATPLAPKAGPALALDAGLDLRLQRDEQFLPVEGGGAFVTVRGEQSVVCRRGNGAVVWERTVPFAPSWAAMWGDLLLVAGERGVAALARGDGADVWHWPAPALPRYPTSPARKVRVHEEADDPLPLAGFQIVGSTLLLVQGEGRLFALDAATGRCRWCRSALGAELGLPAPRGRVHHVRAAGRAVFAQMSSQRCVMDLDSGAVRHVAPASRQPWPRPPLAVEDGVIAVSAPGRVERLDSDGKIRWSHTLPGKTTRTGEPPVVLRHGSSLVVIVPENIGLRLRRLDLATGRPVGDAPLIDGSAAPSGWLVDGDVLYHADGGELSARALPGGKLLWRRPLSEPGPWHLARWGEEVVTWPAQGLAARFRFRWLLGAVQWRAGPWPGRADVVEALSPARGGPTRAVRLSPDRLPRYRDPIPVGGVMPTFVLDRLPLGVPGPRVQHGPGGLLVGLGDHVKALVPPPK